ncbi:MAG: polyphosphate kinase 1, partial [Robiginitalea sp.]|nr:polyphosphate kinase 1 [Robiginitalea sp.]
MNKHQYINREISWLRFNERVLQESTDKCVPLIERLRFLGIFSNNLDEFFKVRYATVKRIVQAGKSGKSVLGGEKAKDLLEEITNIVIRQQKESQVILKQIEEELEEENIFLIDETEIQEHQEEFLKTYFIQNVSPSLMTIILDEHTEFPRLKDSAAYLAIKMVLLNTGEDPANTREKQYALIEIPREIDRFIVLPKVGDKDYIILLD